MGRYLIFIGAFCLVAGLFLHYGPRVPWLGRLPGDILMQRKGFTFYFPLTTSILLSLLLSLVLWLLRR